MDGVDILVILIVVLVVILVIYRKRLSRHGLRGKGRRLRDQYRKKYKTCNCNCKNSVRTYDECVHDAIVQVGEDVVAAITNEGDETQQLIQNLINTIDDGVDVNATLVGITPSVEAQLQALIQAALEAVEPIQVEVTNFADMLATLQAALQWAANNLQFDVLATQNGNWIVDLLPATIAAIETAFENALGNVIVDVFVTNSTITVIIDPSSLSALEEINVNILGQPIQVEVTNEITLDAGTISAIATAIAGETLTVDITGQPIQVTGTIDLGDVSALTDWLALNDLNIDDADIIAAINGISFTDLDDGDDDVEVELTGMVPIGCVPDETPWYTYFENRYTETGTLSSQTQWYTDGVSNTMTAPVGNDESNCAPPQIVIGPPDVEGLCFNFNGTDDEDLGLPPGTMGKLNYIADHGGGVVRVSFDGSSPDDETYPEFNEDNGATLNLNGVDLGLLVFNGSAGGSDYTVCVEAYGGFPASPPPV